MFQKTQESKPKLFILFILISFVTTLVMPPCGYAQVAGLNGPSFLDLPAPGVMVTSTQAFDPAKLLGMNLYPDNPLLFDFIVGHGDSGLEGDAFKQESKKLIEYFLAALTIPQKELWVNLSPYENNRIVPKVLGQTALGRDMLAQDYMLKQLASSIMHPDEPIGQEFWQKVYKKAYDMFGTTEIPISTYNKVWIIPESMDIYEHDIGVFIVDSHLKVMLEEDYLALEANQGHTDHGLGTKTLTDMDSYSGVSSQIVRDVLIPEIEREVNEGQIFANLRQMMSAIILASWYKDTLKESLLTKIYADQEKVNGVTIEDETVIQDIYERYVQAFKTGVYDFIREEYDDNLDETLPRKYFSGGARLDTAQAEETKRKPGQGGSAAARDAADDTGPASRVRTSLTGMAEMSRGFSDTMDQLARLGRYTSFTGGAHGMRFHSQPQGRGGVADKTQAQQLTDARQRSQEAQRTQIAKETQYEAAKTVHGENSREALSANQALSVARLEVSDAKKLLAALQAQQHTTEAEAVEAAKKVTAEGAAAEEVLKKAEEEWQAARGKMLQAEEKFSKLEDEFRTLLDVEGTMDKTEVEAFIQQAREIEIKMPEKIKLAQGIDDGRFKTNIMSLFSSLEDAGKEREKPKEPLSFDSLAEKFRIMLKDVLAPEKVEDLINKARRAEINMEDRQKVEGAIQGTNFTTRAMNLFEKLGNIGQEVRETTKAAGPLEQEINELNGGTAMSDKTFGPNTLDASENTPTAAASTTKMAEQIAAKKFLRDSYNVPPDKAQEMTQQLIKGKKTREEIMQEATDILLRSGAERTEEVKSVPNGQLNLLLKRLQQAVLEPQGTSARPTETGGIDFNDENMMKNIQRNGDGVIIPQFAEPINLDNVEVEGFSPVILNVAPITNLPLILGMETGEDGDTGTGPADESGPQLLSYYRDPMDKRQITDNS